MNITGEMTIFRTDKGVHKLFVKNEEILDDGTTKPNFMSVNVGFKKGIDVKNRTRIKVSDAFLSFFKVDTNEVDNRGNKIYRKYPKIMIIEFEILEEGIDEPLRTKSYNGTQNNNKVITNTIPTNNYNKFNSIPVKPEPKITDNIENDIDMDMYFSNEDDLPF